MDPGTVLEYIETTGYKTSAELCAQFSSQDQEILGNTLTYLITKNSIRKSKFQGISGHEELFYIPQK